jgi:hypothetical protein
MAAAAGSPGGELLAGGGVVCATGALLVVELPEIFNQITNANITAPIPAPITMP